MKEDAGEFDLITRKGQIIEKKVFNDSSMSVNVTPPLPVSHHQVDWHFG